MKNALAAILACTVLCGTAIAAADLDEPARAVCKCMEAPYAQARKAMAQIRQAQASGDTQAMIAAQGQMMGTVSSGSRCFDGLARRFPEIDRSEELQRKVMARAESMCPNPMKSMQQGG